MRDSLDSLKTRSTWAAVISALSSAYKYTSMGQSWLPILKVIRKYMTFFDLFAGAITLIVGAVGLAGLGELPCLTPAVIRAFFSDAPTNLSDTSTLTSLAAASGSGLLLQAAHYVALTLLNSPWCTARGDRADGM